MAYSEISDKDLDNRKRATRPEEPENGFMLYHESWGTSVTLGGSERKATVITNCTVQWGNWFNYREDYVRNFEQWEQERYGYLVPSNPLQMAMAVIVEDEDLNNCSQLETYEYIIIWSPSKKNWIRPQGRAKKLIDAKYLQSLI